MEQNQSTEPTQVTEQTTEPENPTEFEDIVDLCFMLDCTGSMQPYIDMACNKIKEVIVKVQEEYPQSQIKIGIVAYRDIGDKNRFEIFPFEASADKAKAFLAELIADGGNDTPEDVNGAFQKALFSMDWQNSVRLLVHIADAPCHGKEFHDDSYDKYPDGHEEDMAWDKIFKELVEKRVDYLFIKILSETDKMFEKFRGFAEKNGSLESEVTFQQEEIPMPPEGSRRGRGRGGRGGRGDRGGRGRGYGRGGYREDERRRDYDDYDDYEGEERDVEEHDEGEVKEEGDREEADKGEVRERYERGRGRGRGGYGRGRGYGRGGYRRDYERRDDREGLDREEDAKEADEAEIGDRREERPSRGRGRGDRGRGRGYGRGGYRGDYERRDDREGLDREEDAKEVDEAEEGDREERSSRGRGGRGGRGYGRGGYRGYDREEYEEGEEDVREFDDEEYEEEDGEGDSTEEHFAEKITEGVKAAIKKKHNKKK